MRDSKGPFGQEPRGIKLKTDQALKEVTTMAWGIMMTGLTLVGMLGLMIFGLSGQENPASANSRVDANTMGMRRRAA
jgi:hypothetical protein